MLVTNVRYGYNNINIPKLWIIIDLYQSLKNYNCKFREDLIMNENKINEIPKKYCLWSICDDEIIEFVRQLGIRNLSEEQIRQIIYQYKKAIEWCLCNSWESILKECINEIVKGINFINV